MSYSTEDFYDDYVKKSLNLQKLKNGFKGITDLRANERGFDLLWTLAKELSGGDDLDTLKCLVSVALTNLNVEDYFLMLHNYDTNITIGGLPEGFQLIRSQIKED